MLIYVLWTIRECTHLYVDMGTLFVSTLNPKPSNPKPSKPESGTFHLATVYPDLEAHGRKHWLQGLRLRV